MERMNDTHEFDSLEDRIEEQFEDQIERPFEIPEDLDLELEDVSDVVQDDHEVPTVNSEVDDFEIESMIDNAMDELRHLDLKKDYLETPDQYYESPYEAEVPDEKMQVLGPAQRFFRGKNPRSGELPVSMQRVENYEKPYRSRGQRYRPGSTVSGQGYNRMRPYRR